VRDHVEVGFFTDPTVCIGCKACEVACKEWNQVPDDGYTWSGNSYDNTGPLGASTWRHVMFLEQDRAKGNQIVGPMSLDPTETSVRGIHAFFLILGEPRSLRTSVQAAGPNYLSKFRVDIGLRDRDRIHSSRHSWPFAFFS
jgi:hypothetical protein